LKHQAAEQQRQQELALKEARQKNKAAVEAKNAENTAVIHMRRFIQKLSNVTPESFQAVKTELEAELRNKAASLGSQFSVVREEADGALKQTQTRIEAMRDAIRKKTEEKVELKKQAEAALKDLERQQSELGDLVDVAEAKADLLKEASEPFLKEGNLSIEDVGPKLAHLEELNTELTSSCEACRGFISQHKLLDPVDPWKQKFRADIVKLTARADTALKAAQGIMRDARASKMQVIQRIAVKQRLQDDDDLFKKYDLSGKGCWDREAVLKYVKGEFDFTISTDALDRVFSNIVSPGESGVRRDRLTSVRSLVGIARDAERSKVVRAEREERERKEAAEREMKEKALAETKAKLEERLKEADGADGMSSATPLEKEFTKADEKVRLLGLNMGVKTSEEIAESIHELAKLAKSIEQPVADLEQRVEVLDKVEVDPDLTNFWRLEFGKRQARVERLKARLARVDSTVVTSRETMTKRKALEAEKFRSQVVGLLRTYMRENGVDSAALFAKMCEGKEDAKLSQPAFIEFLRETCKCECSEEELGKFFAHISSSDGENLGSEAFDQLLKFFYKVVESTVVTTGLSIKDSGTVRRVKAGEMIELLEGPKKEELACMMRIKGKAVKDGSIGWITVAGNQGKTFLEEGGNLYKVRKETPLTERPPTGDVAKAEAAGGGGGGEKGSHKAKDEKDTQCSGNKVVRLLRKGEVVEILEWERVGDEEEEKAAARIKARAKVDGVVGWTFLSKLQVA